MNQEELKSSNEIKIASEILSSKGCTINQCFVIMSNPKINFYELTINVKNQNQNETKKIIICEDCRNNCYNGKQLEQAKLSGNFQLCECGKNYHQKYIDKNAQSKGKEDKNIRSHTVISNILGINFAGMIKSKKLRKDKNDGAIEFLKSEKNEHNIFEQYEILKRGDDFYDKIPFMKIGDTESTYKDIAEQLTLLNSICKNILSVERTVDQTSIPILLRLSNLKTHKRKELKAFGLKIYRKEIFKSNLSNCLGCFENVSPIHRLLASNNEIKNTDKLEEIINEFETEEKKNPDLNESYYADKWNLLLFKEYLKCVTTLIICSYSNCIKKMFVNYNMVEADNYKLSDVFFELVKTFQNSTEKKKEEKSEEQGDKELYIQISKQIFRIVYLTFLYQNDFCFFYYCVSSKEDEKSMKKRDNFSFLKNRKINQKLLKIIFSPAFFEDEVREERIRLIDMLTNPNDYYFNSIKQISQSKELLQILDRAFNEINISQEPFDTFEKQIFSFTKENILNKMKEFISQFDNTQDFDSIMNFIKGNYLTRTLKFIKLANILRDHDELNTKPTGKSIEMKRYILNEFLGKIDTSAFFVSLLFNQKVYKCILDCIVPKNKSEEENLIHGLNFYLQMIKILKSFKYKISTLGFLRYCFKITELKVDNNTIDSILKPYKTIFTTFLFILKKIIAITDDKDYPAVNQLIAHYLIEINKGSNYLLKHTLNSIKNHLMPISEEDIQFSFAIISLLNKIDTNIYNIIKDKFKDPVLDNSDEFYIINLTEEILKQTSQEDISEAKTEEKKPEEKKPEEKKPKEKKKKKHDKKKSKDKDETIEKHKEKKKISIENINLNFLKHLILFYTKYNFLSLYKENDSVLLDVKDRIPILNKIIIILNNMKNFSKILELFRTKNEIDQPGNESILIKNIFSFWKNTIATPAYLIIWKICYFCSFTGYEQYYIYQMTYLFYKSLDKMIFFEDPFTIYLQKPNLRSKINEQLNKKNFGFLKEKECRECVEMFSEGLSYFKFFAQGIRGEPNKSEKDEEEGIRRPELKEKEKSQNNFNNLNLFIKNYPKFKEIEEDDGNDENNEDSPILLFFNYFDEKNINSEIATKELAKYIVRAIIKEICPYEENKKKKDSISTNPFEFFKNCDYSKSDILKSATILFKLYPQFWQSELLEIPNMTRKIINSFLGDQIFFFGQISLYHHLSILPHKCDIHIDFLLNQFEFIRLLCEDHNPLFQTILIHSNEYFPYNNKRPKQTNIVEFSFEISNQIVLLQIHNQRQQLYINILYNEDKFDNLGVIEEKLTDFRVEVIQGTTQNNLFEISNFEKFNGYLDSYIEFFDYLDKKKDTITQMCAYFIRFLNCFCEENFVYSPDNKLGDIIMHITSKLNEKKMLAFGIKAFQLFLEKNKIDDDEKDKSKEIRSSAFQMDHFMEEEEEERKKEEEIKDKRKNFYNEEFRNLYNNIYLRYKKDEEDEEDKNEEEEKKEEDKKDEGGDNKSNENKKKEKELCFNEDEPYFSIFFTIYMYINRIADSNLSCKRKYKLALDEMKTAKKKESKPNYQALLEKIDNENQESDYEIKKMYYLLCSELMLKNDVMFSINFKPWINKEGHEYLNKYYNLLTSKEEDSQKEKDNINIFKDIIQFSSEITNKVTVYHLKMRSALLLKEEDKTIFLEKFANHSDYYTKLSGILKYYNTLKRITKIRKLYLNNEMERKLNEIRYDKLEKLNVIFCIIPNFMLFFSSSGNLIYDIGYFLEVFYIFGLICIIYIYLYFLKKRAKFYKMEEIYDSKKEEENEKKEEEKTKENDKKKEEKLAPEKAPNEDKDENKKGETTQELLIKCMRIIWLESEIFPFVWNCFFGLLGLVFSFFFSFQLVSTFNVSQIMKSVLIAIKQRYGQFLATFFLLVILLFFYGSVTIYSFYYIEETQTEICGKYFECFLYLLNSGLRSGGVPFEPKVLEQSGFWSEFIYSWIFYFLIILIILNIFNGIIVDTFQSLRENNQQINDQKDNYCFICQLRKNKFESKGIDFEQHKKEEHNVFNYFCYMFTIQDTDPHDLNSVDYQVYQYIEKGSVNFFPIVLEKGNEDDTKDN